MGGTIRFELPRSHIKIDHDFMRFQDHRIGMRKNRDEEP